MCIGEITIEIIKEWFISNYQRLILDEKQFLTQKQKEEAMDQVIDYFCQNYDILRKIKKT
jgi:hypothetical protein